MSKGFLRAALALVAATACGAALADDAKLVTRSYPVGEFVVSFRPAPTLTPQAAPLPAVEPPQAGRFAVAAPTPPPVPVRQLPPEVRGNAEALARLVANMVKPYSWAGMGGAGRVAFDEATCSLVVTQTADVHAHVADLIASMRRVHMASMPLVQLELTAVEVPESLLETAGVDADATVTTVKGAEVPVEWSPPDRPNWAAWARQAERTAGGPKPPTAVLSDDQVKCLMKCVQANRHTNVLTRPTLMLADMQTGHFQVGETARFLTGLELTAGPNGVERKPRYRTVQLGTTITATPKVSADRRFVQLRLNYRTAQPAQMTPATAVKVGDGTETEVMSAPAVDIQTIETTMAIPAGGTMLLAGPVTTREERTEFGPPVLSKVPYVSRLYANVGYSRAHYRHLLLVTAKVVTPPSECCAAPACKAAAPAADCKACPAACETVAVAKPVRPPETEASRLVAAYHKACADGRTEDAIRLAMQALSRDPNCFADQK